MPIEQKNVFSNYNDECIKFINDNYKIKCTKILVPPLNLNNKVL